MTTEPAPAAFDIETALAKSHAVEFSAANAMLLPARLIDYLTGADLGPATPAQVAASDAAAANDGGVGVILVDTDGDPVWEAIGAHSVYTL